MTESILKDEIEFVQKTLQSYYDQNPENAVICHNDLHEGNIMIKEGLFENGTDVDPGTLIFVDYDNAAYGFRTWDLLYSMSKWGFDPSNQHVDQFIQGQLLLDYTRLELYFQSM